LKPLDSLHIQKTLHLKRVVNIPADALVVETTYGPIRGTEEQAIRGQPYKAFKGIPYAAPPIGDLRFAVSMRIHISPHCHKIRKKSHEKDSSNKTQNIREKGS